MSENITVTAGSGTTVAADDISDVKYQKVKLVDGTADATAAIAVDVGVKANAIRTAPANNITDGTYIGDIKFGEALPAGTAEIGKLAAGTAEIGNVKNAGTFAVQSTLQTGANAIGKLAANSGVDIGDVDVTSLPVAAQDTNYFTATITSADAQSATAVKAKTADKKIYVTSIIASTDTALNLQFQDDNTPTVLMEQIYLAANGGMAISASCKELPLFVVGTNYDLDVIASGAGNISVTVSGYVAT